MSLEKINTNGLQYDLLVVESNKSDYCMLDKYLSLYKSFLNVERATTWAQAIDKTRRHKYDRVLFSLDANNKGSNYVGNQLNHLETIVKSGHEANAIYLTKSEDVSLLDLVKARGCSDVAYHPAHSFSGFEMRFDNILKFLASSRDPLTQLYTKTEFERHLKAFCEGIISGYRSGTAQNAPADAAPESSFEVLPLSIIYLDLDGFKAVNDLHGHAEADLILKKIGRMLSNRQAPPSRQDEKTRGVFSTLLRSSDLACREHGDEFMICLPNTDLKGTVVVLDRLEKMIQTTDFGPEFGKQDVYMGFSVGLSRLTVPKKLNLFESYVSGDCSNDLIKRAERAMAVAKLESKKNRSELMKKNEQRFYLSIDDSTPII